MQTNLFDPDSIRLEIDKDLPGSLRTLAASLESGIVTARCSDVIPMAGRGDEIGVLIRLIIVAPLLSRTRDAAELGGSGPK
jgi:hypothetical protein